MTTFITSFKELFSKHNILIILLFLCMQSALADSLPVFTTEVAVTTAGQNLVISWQADKTAFNYYEVEKSTDGQHFSTIGLVLDAPENSNLCLFKDRKPSASTVWYRIKAINKAGVASYSNSTSYVLENVAAVTCEASAFPNPFTDATVIKLKSNEAGFAEVKVQSLGGQTLLSKQSNISKGYNSIPLDGLSGLTKGIYVARLTINGAVAGNQKLIKN